MSGFMVFGVTKAPNVQSHCVHEERLGAALCKRAKEIAAGSGVKVPKHIKMIGAYGSWISVGFNNNGMKDAFLKAAEELNMPFLRGRDQHHDFGDWA